MGGFTGWPSAAFSLLERLEGDPPSSVRERLRAERELLVRSPMVALMRDLAGASTFYERFTVPGFHKELGPWQRQVGFVRPERNLDQRVSFDLDGLSVEGSAWYFNPGSYTSPGREGFVSAVADEESGPELERILATLRSQGYEVDGVLMKRIPKSYPPGHPRAQLLRQADHPRADLFRLRGVVVRRHLGCKGWLHTAEAFERVRAAFEELRPLTSWYGYHVPSG